MFSFENPKGRYFKVSLNPDRCNNIRYVESHGSPRCSTLEILQPSWTPLSYSYKRKRESKNSTQRPVMDLAHMTVGEKG